MASGGRCRGTRAPLHDGQSVPGGPSGGESREDSSGWVGTVTVREPGVLALCSAHRPRYSPAVWLPGSCSSLSLRSLLGRILAPASLGGFVQEASWPRGGARSRDWHLQAGAVCYDGCWWTLGAQHLAFCKLLKPLCVLLMSFQPWEPLRPPRRGMHAKLLPWLVTARGPRPLWLQGAGQPRVEEHGPPRRRTG